MTVDYFDRYGDHFSAEAVRSRLAGLPGQFGRDFALRVLLLQQLLVDDETPAWARALIVAVLGGLLLLLDTTPLLAVTGDAAARALLSHQLRAYVPAVQEKAERLLPERYHE